MKLVGLTGGIACGKSTVAEALRARGVPVIDADRVSREVLAPGSSGLATVVARFGAELLRADGSLDRKALGARVVHDAQARKGLEAITHPLIIGAIAEQAARLAQQGHPVAVVEAALMVETGTWRRYDAVLVVRCTEATQIARLVAREGMDEATARRWLAAQLPVAEKARRVLEEGPAAGVRAAVIDNDGDRAELAEQLDAAWATLLAEPEPAQ